MVRLVTIIITLINDFCSLFSSKCFSRSSNLRPLTGFYTSPASYNDKLSPFVIPVLDGTFDAAMKVFLSILTRVERRKKEKSAKIIKKQLEKDSD